MSMSSPAVCIGWREPLDAYALLEDFEHALEWLERSSALSGGLSPAYDAQRANFARRLERGIP